MREVYWAVLLERSIGEHAAQALLDVAMRAGEHGYTRIFIPYTRTDIARNTIVGVFKDKAKDRDDVLVMLDCDHVHPIDVVERLAAHEVGVVGALAFRRGVPYFPCFFVEGQMGKRHVIVDWPEGLLEGVVVGTGAIAIKRWVFDELDAAGYGWPYFRYQYPAGDPVHPSEDIYFGECCQAVGIPHYCDTTLETPHITVGLVDSNSWKLWQEDHPEVRDPNYDQQLLYNPSFAKASGNPTPPTRGEGPMSLEGVWGNGRE